LQRSATFAEDAAWVGPMIVSDARRILELLDQIEMLDQQVAQIAPQSSMARHIDSIPGFGPICSAELAGEIGSMERFRSEASLALYLGMAVLDDSSGATDGARSTRHVNARCKNAMMTASMRHLEDVPQSRTYYDKKRAEGKPHNHAVRCLGRHLVRVMWALIHEDRDYEVR
jgi:transposase